MDFIQRQLQQTIEDRLFQGKAIILIGARQVGKSTLFHQIIANKEQVLTLNCDDPEARNLLENANLSELRQLLADNRIVLRFLHRASCAPPFVFVYLPSRYWNVPSGLS